MANIESTKTGNVALQLNGITVDMDVISKDAEIELNNNNNNNNEPILVKPIEINVPKIIENTSESAIDSKDDYTKNDSNRTKSNEQSTLNTDNNNEEKATNKSTEDDSTAFDEKNETMETLKTSETSETSEHLKPSEESKLSTQAEVSSNDAESKENPQSDSKSSGISDDISEKLTESEVVSNDMQSNVTKQEKDNTVTSTKPTQQEDDQNDNDAVNDTAKNDSSQKSTPRKTGSEKKRKNRTRTQKKVDYSEFMKYTVSVSQRQRRYFLLARGGRNGYVAPPDDDCEIFCTNIPINVREGELVPLFERYGKIWELRLKMSYRNPKRNAGFAFVRYTSHEAAVDATEKLNNYEILPGKHLSIRLSQPNLSLFVGNIHRGLTREQIHEKINSRTKGLVKTFVKNSLYEDTKNCGFCFLEYDSHSAALEAKRLLNKGVVWGRQLFVDWAQRRKQPEESDLNESTTIFINYLPKETSEEMITETLSSFGTIEKITKIKDYAFVLFTDHQSAADAMNGADKMKLGSENVEISLAIPKTMKSRPRVSSFSFRQNRRNNHNQFKRYRSSFNSSNKFNTHKQQMDSNNKYGNKNEFVEQTIMPMPTMDATTAQALEV